VGSLTIHTPVGELRLTGDEALTAVHFSANGADEPTPVLAAAAAQLEEYLAGERTSFDLPLSPRGTEFQRRVWDALVEIPYGETVSYAELARRVGAPAAVRAVGAANGRNPLSIVVPCHRVVGSDGSLTGYGGGLPAKRWLLDLERSARAGVSGLRPGSRHPPLNDHPPTGCGFGCLDLSPSSYPGGWSSGWGGGS
jgi:methylated-DNA-[protein]-cysteine S-methyltransferase